MQIVIDIPEEIYRQLINGRSGNTLINKAIKNGIPLPKGHGRLIDADALKMDIRSNYGYEEYEKSEFCYELDDAPTVLEADKDMRGDTDADS